MPEADCACKVINGKSGYIRDNTSWVIGRLVRDYERWMDKPVEAHLKKMIADKLCENKAAAEALKAGFGADMPKPKQAGLCVSFWKVSDAEAGHPGHDLLYYSGIAVAIIQLCIAAIPWGLFGDWSIMLVTACGMVLSLATGCLPQWVKEK
jgi:hypothetical protein